MTFEHVVAASTYAKKVVSGKIVVCSHVINACKRHLDDLKRSEEKTYRYRFDKEKADRACRFIEKMPHIKGRWAGALVKLEPWQKFIVCSLFGWVDKTTGKRRFSEAYIELGRKNGKSFLAAGIGLYMLAADGENGAEVYCGATTEKQAWEVFTPARQMVMKTPSFAKRYGIEVHAKSLTILSNVSKFEPVIGSPGDGPSPHLFIIDEYHEHSDTKMYDTAITGMGAREQPLVLIITTAGTDISSPCKEKSDYIKKMLSGVFENDRVFGIIYTIDDSDEWTDFDNWKKANPNFGVSISEDFLRARHQDAMNIASRQSITKCKHLNIWSSTGSAWINLQKWEQCKSNLTMEDFSGEKCWVAIDLASKIDLCALVVLFRRDEDYHMFVKCYLPEETIELPENDHYQRFYANGCLYATPGARTDFNYIIDDLKSINDNFEISQLGFDPKEATMMINEISNDPEFDFDCVEINQSPASISEPMKEFEALYLSKRLFHEGTPILNWQAGNVVQKMSMKAKAFFPSKEKNANKIDAIVAAIMALYLAMKDTSKPSSWESEDAEVFVI